MGDQYGCRNLTDAHGYYPDQRTDLLTAEDDLVGHAPPRRTHKTAPLAPPALVPSSPNPPINKGIESAITPSIKQEFFHTIGGKPTSDGFGRLTGASPKQT